ncbi:MAG: 3-deoxy-D-manno-octulosonic acid transferase [Ignavibacteriaceae bacterium]
MMSKFWLALYNILFVYPFYVMVLVLSLFNSKIKKGIDGRERLFENLEASLKKIDRSKKLIWFHSSSLGEFEQAKPIIEKIKAETDYTVCVTFFSPSGYENSLKYPYADVVSYIPFDSILNAKHFVNRLNPALAVFMRYDYWPNHVHQLYKQNVPTLIVDATMRDNSPRHAFLVNLFHKDLYSKITKILTVSTDDIRSFRKFGISEQKLLAVGDTRFDRVYQRSLIAKEKNLMNENIIKDKFVFVIGSSWEEDEAVLIPVILKLMEREGNLLVIIAPHEPTLLHLEKLESDFHGKRESIRFSNLNNYRNEKVILIDSIGILLTLYYYADCAFIGGSFKSSIHNVLEAAVYGIPVLYGPKVSTSQEAQALAKSGGGIILRNQRDTYRELKKLIENREGVREKGEISRNYVVSNTGATVKIFEEIKKAIY